MSRANSCTQPDVRLLRSVVERGCLTVRYLTDLMSEGATPVTPWDGQTVAYGPAA